MSKSDDYVPRFTVEITYEQQRKLKELMRWGLQKSVFSILIDTLIELLEKHGDMALAAILSRDLNILDVIKEKKDGNT